MDSWIDKASKKELADILSAISAHNFLAVQNLAQATEWLRPFCDEGVKEIDGHTLKLAFHMCANARVFCAQAFELTKAPEYRDNEHVVAQRHMKMSEGDDE